MAKRKKVGGSPSGCSGNVFLWIVIVILLLAYIGSQSNGSVPLAP